MHTVAPLNSASLVFAYGWLLILHCELIFGSANGQIFGAFILPDYSLSDTIVWLFPDCLVIPWHTTTRRSTTLLLKGTPWWSSFEWRIVNWTPEARMCLCMFRNHSFSVLMVPYRQDSLSFYCCDFACNFSVRSRLQVRDRWSKLSICLDRSRLNPDSVWVVGRLENPAHHGNG